MEAVAILGADAEKHLQRSRAYRERGNVIDALWNTWGAITCLDTAEGHLAAEKRRDDRREPE